MKKSVQIIEVGLRDGLQNEKVLLSENVRLALADRLIDAGIRRLEVGSFVRYDRVPQMQGSYSLIRKVKSRHTRVKDLHLSALVPNVIGFEKAAHLPLNEVAFFTAASETFCQKNINCSIDESLQRFSEIFARQKKDRPDLKVRGYISTCFGCPFEGWIDESQVVRIAKELIRRGCFEVSIGDTIGAAEPQQVRSLFKKLTRVIPARKLAGHFHNTRGLALVNIQAALEGGIRKFDSSIGGLGGCPFAPGAAGNVATEDVVYMLHGSGFDTGLDLQKLIATSRWLAPKMPHPLAATISRVGTRFAS